MKSALFVVVALMMTLSPSGVDSQGAAAAAANIDKIIPAISGTLTSGSSNTAYVRWIGHLNYRIKEKHGKVVQRGSDNYGGTIAVTKRNSAWIGAEHIITFTSPRTGKAIAEVYMTTFYSGAQPQVRLTYGDRYFATKTITAHGSTALILALKAPV